MAETAAVQRESGPAGPVATLSAIALAHLRRDYGERTALRDLTLELREGQTLAVLGPNGAGKTTLLRILATLLRPTAGEVSVLGCALPREAWKARGRIGYLGHEPLCYRDLTCAENLRFQARLHGLGEEATERIAELLDRVRMSRWAGELVRNLSAGMVQRLAVCRAVLHDPELLLLDEPRSHLDPEAAALVEPLIGSRRGAHPRSRHSRDRGRARRGRPRAGAEGGRGCGLRGSGERTVGRRRPGDLRGGAVSASARASSRQAFEAILAKDLRVELRTLQSVPAMVLFAVTTFVLFRFGLDREELSGSLAAGVLLATVLFAAILAINRLFVAERDEGGFDAIRLAPVDGTALAAAKATALVVYLLALEAIALPVFAVFFLDSWAGLAPLAGILLLADLGLAATGVLVSAIAANSRARDLLVPLVLLPLLVPVMIAAGGAAEPLLAAGGPSYDGIAKWLAILALYDVVFLLVGYAVYDFLLED